MVEQLTKLREVLYLQLWFHYNKEIPICNRKKDRYTVQGLGGSQTQSFCVLKMCHPPETNAFHQSEKLTWVLVSRIFTGALLHRHD